MSRRLKVLFGLICIIFLNLFTVFRASASVNTFNVIHDYLRSGATNGNFSNARGVELNSAGYVYIADYSNNRIQKLDSNLVYVSKIGAFGTANGQFKSPSDVALYTVSGTPDIDYVYVADTSNNRIQKFSVPADTHVFTHVWTVGGTAAGSGQSQFSSPRGVATDGTYVYVADTSNNRISIYQASDGAYVSEFGSSGTGNGQFSGPYDVDVDSSGNIYVADYTNGRIQKFDSSYNYLSQFGSVGTSEGQIKYAASVSVDSSGNTYVADTLNKRIQKFNSSGEFLAYTSTNGSPYGVDINGSGTIVYIDQNEHLYQADYTGVLYQISNLDASLDIIDTSNNHDLEVGSYFGTTSTTARLKDSNGLTISDVAVTLGSDADWSSVAGDSDRAAGKSFVANLTSAPGTAATHTLYVPVPENRTSTSVRICPDATSMVDVSGSCTNGVSHSAGGPYVESFGTITVSYIDTLGDSVTYWKIEGMTASGGISEGISAFSGSGGGTSGDPYQITTCAQLQEMENDRGAYYSIVQNIDCTATTGWNGGNGFIPVGITPASPFVGSLTGSSSYAIDGLYEFATQDGMGLFGYASGATINTVRMTNLNYEKDATGLDSMGGLVGYMTGGSITNSTTAGTITQTASAYNTSMYTGGMVGYMASDATITGSTSSVNITLREESYYGGGLVGYMTGTSSISNSHATGNVFVGHTANDNGGFVGSLAGTSTITTSDSSGEFKVGAPSSVPTSGSFNNGGFAGSIISTGASITNSHSDTNVTIVLLDSNTSQVWNTGGFIGDAGTGATIDNCYSTGTITLDNTATQRGGYYYIGGFVGYMYDNSSNPPSITNSYSTGNLDIDQANGGTGVGGFVGRFTSNSTITDSYSTSSINIGPDDGTDTQYTNSVGGFVGDTVTGGTISRNYATGNITTDGYVTSVGGFIGQANGTTLAISKSWAEGNVEGLTSVGGFVGFFQFSSGATITDAYSRGNAYAYDSGGFVDVGGFGGYIRTSAFTNVYSTGVPSAANATGSNIGGLVGYNGGVTVTNSYWDTETSTVATSPVGTGLTTSEMKTQSSYSGWDFGTIWEFVSGVNDDYPVLQFANFSSPSSPGTPASPAESTTLADAGSSTSCPYGISSNAPNLFSAKRTGAGKNKDEVVLYFTPIDGNVTGYNIFYGFSPGDERFSTQYFVSPTGGVLSYTLEVQSKQSYTFWVQAFNDCAAGPISNYLTVDKKGTTGSPTPPPAPSPTPEPSPVPVAETTPAPSPTPTPVPEEPVDVQIVVEDILGLTIDDANVEIASQTDSGILVETTTDENGKTDITLPIGSYEITVDRGGGIHDRSFSVNSESNQIVVRIPVVTAKDADYITKTMARTTVGVAGTFVVSESILASTSVIQTLGPVYQTTGRAALFAPIDFLVSMGQWTYQTVSSLFLWFFGWMSKKKKSKAVTFDSSVGSGIAGTYVLLYAADGTIKSDFTDTHGHFAIQPRPNRYKLRADKVNYLYPSKIINVSSNSIYDHIYTPGEEIVIESEGQVVSDLAVPLDPEEKEKGIRLIFGRLSAFIISMVKKIRVPFLLVGLASSGLATYFSLTTLNIVFLVISALSLVAIFIGNKSKDKSKSSFKLSHISVL